MISIASNEADFIELSCKMIKYLFWQGLRLQQNYEQLQGMIAQFVPEDYSEPNPNINKPSPLLAILGLPFEVIKQHVEKVLVIYWSFSYSILGESTFLEFTICFQTNH